MQTFQLNFPQIPANFPVSGKMADGLEGLIYKEKKLFLPLFTPCFPVFPPCDLSARHRHFHIETPGKTGKREIRPKFGLEAAPLLTFAFSRSYREIRRHREIPAPITAKKSLPTGTALRREPLAQWRRGMALATCRRCLNDFHREEHEIWKLLCLPCWIESKNARAANRESLLLDEIASWKGRALTAEQSLAELKARAPALDLETLRRIRMLVHPDKHGGSAMANEITKTLNDWIGRSA